MNSNYDSKEYIEKVDAWWRAANYISVAQMYLKDNPLLRKPLKKEDVKTHPIGHWGTIAGQNFLYAHLNRVINKYDLNMFYIEGPVMVVKSWCQIPISMAATVKFIQKSLKMKLD